MEANEVQAQQPAQVALEVASQSPASITVTPGFQSRDAWELVQRQAKALMSADIVPVAYKNNIGNCIIALDMAYRIGANPLLVMQNLHVIQGKPGWSAQFLIATFNKCGRFSSLRYEWNKEKTECRAWAIEKSSNERIEGAKITMAMAQSEGWATKPGSKWKTMPELMLQYRAAAFLIRTYAPEIAMGIHMAEEVEDIVASGDDLCSAGQVGMIESLLITAEIRQEEKDEIERSLSTMSGSQAIKCIMYLKDKQARNGDEVAAEQYRNAKRA